MKQFLRRHYHAVQWAIGGLVVAAAIAAWASVRLDGTGELTTYDIFPVFGLLAFSLMWTHYIHGVIRRYVGKADRTKDAYWYASSAVVLACLLLHPFLLSFGLWQDGLGLPPFSYLNAYESMRLAVLLGSLSLVIFLAFELHRWLAKRSWWRYVDRLQFVAMLAIFLHALTLGGELNVAWFYILWWGYGLTLIAAYVYSYRYDKKARG